MGVDCRITLPPQVRVGDVAGIIGTSAGCPKEWQSSGDTRWAHVQGVTVKGLEDLPECPRIAWTKGTVYETGSVMYHYEWGHPSGGPGLMPRSTPFWLAVAHRLVDFYGGIVDYSDCDDTDEDYAVPARALVELAPAQDPHWTAFQERLMAIEPLTQEEIAQHAPLAAYD